MPAGRRAHHDGVSIRARGHRCGTIEGVTTPAESHESPAKPNIPTPPPKRRGMKGNAKSMVLSMIACIAGCLVILALIPRQGPTPRETVDAKGVASQVKTTQKWDVALADGIGQPWRPVNVTLIPGDKSRPARWLAGYQGKGEDYLSIQQTANGGDKWVNTVAAGAREGTMNVNGVTWTKISLEKTDGKAIARQGKLGGLDTVIIGQGTWEQLAQFAKAAKPLSAIK